MEESNDMCYHAPWPGPPKTLFDRILGWGEPAVLIAPAVAAVAVAAATGPPDADLALEIIVAAIFFFVLLPPVGLAAAFITLAVAALAAAIQATWSALRR